MTAFKIGDKVVPVSKLGQEDLLIYSVCWNRAKKNKQPFLYFNGYIDGHVVCSDQKTNEPTGDFFNECDLKPYFTKNERISNLEKELAHMKEQFQQKIQALEMVLAEKSKLRQVDVYEHVEPSKQGVQRLIKACEQHFPPQKSANQLRAEIIEKAKGFIDATATDDTHFEIEGNQVLAWRIIRKGTGYDALTGLGVCPPDKVFNEHIERAIAVGRLEGLDVSEFENAVQPNEITRGMHVRYVNGRIAKVVDDGSILSTTVSETFISTAKSNVCGILNDTNAIYTEEVQ